MRNLDSGFQNYSSEEAAATSKLMQSEDPRWRWVFPVTRATRNFFTGQFPVLKVCYISAVALIFLTAAANERVPPPLLGYWLLESIANFLLRYLLTDALMIISPVSIASRRLLRLVPVFAIVLATLHWCWTATLFIGPELDATGLVTLVCFFMLSVAITSIAPASPAICVIYLVPMWSTTAFLLRHAQWASFLTFFTLAAALAGVIWSALVIVENGVRKVLVRGDRTDMLVADLSESNAEIKRLHGLAARELAMRSEFFSSVSHDFRQRLLAVKMLAQAMLESAVHPEDKRSASQLISVADGMDHFMTDVLEFGKLENVRLFAKRQRVELQDVFRQLAVIFDDLAVQGGPETVVHTTSAVLNTDPAMLLRVLENLMSNALKFTRGRILLSARRRGDRVEIDVRDQGLGIPEETIGSIFNAFYRGEPADQSRHGGVGLGLAIVRRFADTLGYKVEVHTRIGRGTLMRVIVPASDVESREQSR